MVVGYFVYINYILKKGNNTTNTPNSNDQAQNTPNLDNIKVTKTSVDQKTKAVEEFAKEFDGKAEYDKEKNVIGINLKNSESLEEGKKEDTGKEILHPMEVREKITKIIEGMGLVQIQLSMPEPIGETDATYVAIVKNTKGEYRSMQLRFVRNMDGNISKKIRFLSLAL